MALAVGAGLARAQPSSPKDDPGISFEDGFPLTRSDRIYHLDEVERGQRGVGYTVFEADRLEPFEVEILGVMEGMLGPGEDVVLARLSGDRIEFTGVIAGMSGSPVYVDGRLLGAVAYRFGSFTKEPIAGITPIERMLPLLERSEPASGGPGAAAVALGPSLGRAPRDALGPVHPPRPSRTSGPAFTPIRTPFVASGLHPAALARLGEGLRPLGPTTAPAGRGPSRGSNGPATAGKVRAAPIRPGAPIAALLARGDVNLSAIGTVTFVEGDAVLGFGHPFVGQGTVEFPLATAAILNTLVSEAGSYKQGLAAREVGVVSQDRLTAIAGRLGAPSASMVPVEIVVEDEGRDSPPDRTRVEVVDSSAWLPTLTDTVVASAVLRRIGAEAGGTVELRAGIEVGSRFLEIVDAYAAPSPTKVAAFAARDVATLVAIISRNEFEPANIRTVRVEMQLTSEVRMWTLESARLVPEEVAPGGTVAVHVRLRPYRGDVIERRLEIRVPPGAAPGSAEVFVGGGLELDGRDASARGQPDPDGLDALLGALADRRPAQAVYARLYLPGDGLRLGPEVLPGIPPSARAALSSHPALTPTAIQEVPGPEARLALSGVVEGGRALGLEIRSNPQRDAP